MFRVRTFIGASAAAAATSAGAMALIIYITLWFQSVLGASPLGAGTRLLALTAPILLLAPVGGRLSSIVPARAMLCVGLACIAGGGFAMSQVSAASQWSVLVPGLALAGVGLGLSAPALSSTAVSIVPPWRTGMASGLNYTARQLGLATGIAALGAVFEHQVRASTVTALAHSPLAARAGTLGKVIAGGGARGVLAAVHGAPRRALEHTVHASFASGLSHIFEIAAVIAAIGALAGLALVSRRDAYEAG
jgi:predicted MFS family arabinose efflux permease